MQIEEVNNETMATEQDEQEGEKGKNVNHDK